MAHKYWIDNSFIDTSRNLVARGGATEILPPKALAVLTLLAREQGRVVSHDAIMTAVWRETVVSPNSLQRCIAQLRKALGDDSKQQLIIKTHAKQGYSLEAGVRWQTEEQEARSEAKSAAAKFLSLPARLLLAASLCLVVAFGLWPTAPDPLVFNELRPVTASDAKEGNASYSPDGRYIIFHRYHGLCENDIWAKDLQTDKEYKLTREPAWYGSHSFSPDGRQLVFLANQQCQAPEQVKRCRQMMTLELVAALTSPQSPTLLKSCQGPLYNAPHWLNSGDIAMLQKQDARWQIMRHSADGGAAKALYAPTDKALYSLAYSAKDDRLATIGIDPSGQHILELLDGAGNLVSSAKLARPDSLSPFEEIYPVFDPRRGQLVFGTKKKLYALSYLGQITEIAVPLHESIYNASFAPDGKRLVATYGTLDTDVAKVSLSTPPLPLPEQAQPRVLNQAYQAFPSVARSIFRERDGQFQPGGELIAFLSERSGSVQLWLAGDGEARQLTQFPAGAAVAGHNWSADGGSILIAADGRLHRVWLDGRIEPVQTGLVLKQLFRSPLAEQLLLIQTDVGEQLVIWKEGGGKPEVLTGESIHQAAMNARREVVYLDDGGNAWRLDGDKTVKLSLAAFRRGNGKFVMTDEALYGVNDAGWLWSYNLADGDRRMLKQLDRYTTYVSDIRQQQLLVTQVVSAKKEVIELIAGR